MSKKRHDRHITEHQEAQFDFDDAKELTVGEAMLKNEEVEAGVLPGDSILDKYVKQHKDEIEADKFETRQFSKDDLVEKEGIEEIEETQTLDNLLQEFQKLLLLKPLRLKIFQHFIESQIVKMEKVRRNGCFTVF